MRASFTFPGLLLLLSLSIFSCTEQTEELKKPEAPNEYLSLQAGKYIVYRLDSTLITTSGSVQETHSYQEKVIIDSQITDNLGRTSYRVYRFIRDVAGQGQWSSTGSFFITPATSGIEVIENNMRVLKLINPVTLDGTWKGNRFLATDPYESEYEFADDSNIHLEDWDFTYTSKDETLTLNGKTVTNVLTISGPNSTLNYPVTDATAFGSKTFAVDKYAKGLGLVYQELILMEYQPPKNGVSAYRVGFGVKRSMIDHN